MRRHRSIVESKEADAALAAARKKYPRFDDIWTLGYSWRLVRDPESGVLIYPDTYIMKFPSSAALFDDPALVVPGAVLLYTFNEENVHLVDVHVYV